MIDAATATPRSGPRLRFMAILVPFVVRSFVHHPPQRGSEMGAYRAPVMASDPQLTLLEPSLRRCFGADYQKYLRTVPGWWPRLLCGRTTGPSWARHPRLSPAVARLRRNSTDCPL